MLAAIGAESMNATQKLFPRYELPIPFPFPFPVLLVLVLVLTLLPHPCTTSNGVSGF